LKWFGCEQQLKQPVEEVVEMVLCWFLVEVVLKIYVE
jgi:hypothetical protein